MNGITLKAARVNADLTQAEAAAIAGITPVTLRRWESGESLPSTAALIGLCKIYGVNLDDIYLPKK